ncbi:hypothetical protein K9B32_23915 [Rhizobium sp. 3T7]|uniref:carbonic anhydrase n=1 Tax=Rhizobium sp. 3T7 TaxID=2874922 RepID=UPI001CCB24ED|nr:hypothetical protein [Rhizobium sp. 3T7]
MLSCVDSRVPVELVFDQSIGHLVVVRVAGKWSHRKSPSASDTALLFLEPNVSCVLATTVVLHRLNELTSW